jgi:hypothetical protein
MEPNSSGSSRAVLVSVEALQSKRDFLLEFFVCTHTRLIMKKSNLGFFHSLLQKE